MADTPSQESVVSETESNDSTILNDETATAQAFANLLNNDETAKGSEESETPKLEEEKATLEKDNSDPLLEDLDGQEIVDENDASSENEETLYEVKVNGEDYKVNLQELKKGYQLEKNYTKKNMELSDKRKDVDSLQENLTKELEAVKNSRNKYAEQLEVLTQNLQREEKVDWEALYQDNPAEYVRKKAESDKQKEMLQLAQQEKQRIQNEQRDEQNKIYQNYIQNERKILAEKLPVYADKEKGAELTRNLKNFALESGYTEQEIDMMVDHRAVLLLVDAYRYKQLKNTKLQDKKVRRAPRVVSSNASNVREESDRQQDMSKRMNKLKQSGGLQDAQDVFLEMLQ
ncbi:Non-structural protein NSP1 like [uncultured Mediterranean phage uvMED]|nr:Non-structural protein NSP1 like [uncultured Mediterranean phage uvMED]